MRHFGKSISVCTPLHFRASPPRSTARVLNLPEHLQALRQHNLSKDAVPDRTHTLQSPPHDLIPSTRTDCIVKLFPRPISRKSSHIEVRGGDRKNICLLSHCLSKTQEQACSGNWEAGSACEAKGVQQATCLSGQCAQDYCYAKDTNYEAPGRQVEK